MDGLKKSIGVAAWMLFGISVALAAVGVEPPDGSLILVGLVLMAVGSAAGITCLTRPSVWAHMAGTVMLTGIAGFFIAEPIGVGQDREVETLLGMMVLVALPWCGTICLMASREKEDTATPTEVVA